jgi:fatty acid desaturase
MGKGGHNTCIDGDDHEELGSTLSSTTPHRLPTLTEIKVKIPSHCFRPTVRESMSYVVKDIIYVAFTFFVMYQIQSTFKYGFLFFPIYWYIQGLFFVVFFIQITYYLID